MNGCEWQQFNGGRRWRFLDDGSIEVEGQGIPRTRGEPVTMRSIYRAMGHTIAWACERAGVFHLLPTAYALIGSEVGSYKVRQMLRPGETRRTPYVQTDRERWEKKTRARPDGQYSMGPWQFLESTASWMNEKYDLWPELEVITTAELQQPEMSALLAAHYLLHLTDAEDSSDPVLLQAAWNAGSARPMDVTPERPWGLRTFGQDRTGHFIQWYNDAVFVLAENGVII